MMAVMHAGTFVEYGPSESIYANPKKAYTRRLIDSIPRDNLEQINMRQQQRLDAQKGGTIKEQFARKMVEQTNGDGAATLLIGAKAIGAV